MARYLTFALFLTACQVESCKSQDVGLGVARLTVRNAGAVTKLIDRDQRCGFASEAVLGSPKLEGATGTLGSATWTVSDCELRFDEPTTALSTCGGVETKVTGKVTVSGTRTVRGTLTGNPNSPIIPGEADAVRLTLEARFEDFAARRPDSESALTINSGTLAWIAEPRLAVSASKGVCSIATSNVSFTDVTWRDAMVFVESSGRRFDVDVAGSKFDAQVGRRDAQENFLAGELTVFDNAISFPLPGEEPALDPEYDAAAFFESWACIDDLQQPVEFVCPSLQEKVAQGAARLTANLYGRLADSFDEETTCGFASPAVLGRPVLTGTIGERGGTATWTMGGCTKTFAMPTTVKTDCFGAQTLLTGTVTARGTKRVSGLLTGDPSQPIIPTSRDPGQAEMTFELSDLRLSDSVSTSALTVKRGSLSGRIATRTGLNTDLGACSIKTSVAEMTGLAWRDAELLLESDGNSFSLAVASSSLDAQSGSKNGRENYLAGTLMVNGTNVAIPTRGPPVLDPNYDAARFEQSYACKPKLQLVTSEEECDFTRPLAVGAARLLVQSVGALGSLVNRDTQCGFDTTSVKLRPSQVVGDPGELGLMSWGINDCQLGNPAPTLIDQDCNGGRRMISGTATIDATRTVTGLRERRLLVIDSIIPRTRNAVTVSLGAVQLNQLAAWSLPQGVNAPTAKLTIHSGTLSAVVKPVLGERMSEQGTFDLATPVSAMTEISLTNARVTLSSGAKTFGFTIPSARLDAFNGTYLGSSNSLSGTLQVGDKLVTLEPMALNPDFDQVTFDASYRCTDDLRAVIPTMGP